jgi:hypothetical protein
VVPSLLGAALVLTMRVRERVRATETVVIVAEGKSI